MVTNPPSVHIVRALCADSAKEFQLIKFNCPNSLIILTNYHGWCDVYFKFAENPKKQQI